MPSTTYTKPTLTTLQSNENQLASHAYSGNALTPYGSNVTAAWNVDDGQGATIAVIDDGETASAFANFSTLSKSFVTNTTGTSAVAETNGATHGSLTSSIAAGSGASGTAMGIAPGATMLGEQISYSGSFQNFINALSYGGANAGVVDMSFTLGGEGAGNPNNFGYMTWYSAVNADVNTGRGGLGTALVMAAGNSGATNDTTALQPFSSEYQAITVGSVGTDGNPYANATSGPGLLVSVIGTGVLATYPGGGVLAQTANSFAVPQVGGAVALMESANPNLGWRDIQTILAESAYAPAGSTAGFVTNGANDWNGGGMHFSDGEGFGVLDTNVAVNLAKAWNVTQDSANMVTSTGSQSFSATLARGQSVSSSITMTTPISVEHAIVSIGSGTLPAEFAKLVLTSPAGTQSVLLNENTTTTAVTVGNEGDGLGLYIDDNAFLNEQGAGKWTLTAYNMDGSTAGTISNWSLELQGSSGTVVDPLVYTPEFATMATTARETVTPNATHTLDMIALPGAVSINLAGGAGIIDGVNVTVGAGLTTANANGSTGTVVLTAAATGNDMLTGGIGQTTLAGGGGVDTLMAGGGNTVVTTSAAGHSDVDFRQAEAGATGTVSVAGAGDTVWAGAAAVSVIGAGKGQVTVNGGTGTLTFQGILTCTASTAVLAGAGNATVSAGSSSMTFTGSTGTANISGGTQSLVATAGAGAMSVTGGSGGSTVNGGVGTLSVLGGSGTMVVNQAAGNLNATGGQGAVTLNGGAGGMTVQGGAGLMSIVGGTGAMSVTGGTGAMTATAGSGASTIHGGTGSLNVTGGKGLLDVVAAGGASTVTAGTGAATVAAGTGTMLVKAGSGTIDVVGGAGNETVTGGIGAETVTGGAGTIVATGGSAGGNVLTAGTGAATLTGGGTGDVLTASGSAVQMLVAGAGNETLTGGSSTGADMFVAGKGNDAFTAGKGTDTFEFVSGSAGKAYTISGLAGADLIHLSGYAATMPATAVSTQVTDGKGGSMLTLSDGSKIDVLGVAHVTAQMFG